MSCIVFFCSGWWWIGERRVHRPRRLHPLRLDNQTSRHHYRHGLTQTGECSCLQFDSVSYNVSWSQDRVIYQSLWLDNQTSRHHNRHGLTQTGECSCLQLYSVSYNVSDQDRVIYQSLWLDNQTSRHYCMAFRLVSVPVFSCIVSVIMLADHKIG